MAPVNGVMVLMASKTGLAAPCWPRVRELALEIQSSLDLRRDWVRVFEAEIVLAAASDSGVHLVAHTVLY